MTKIKAAVFDLDGTLANTIPALAVSVNKTLKLYGRSEKTEQELYHCINYGTRELIRRAFENTLDESTLDEAVKAYMDFYNKDFIITEKPYSGIKEALEELKGRGIKLGVLTNKPHEITLKLIDIIFGENYFDAVLGQGHYPPKPDPAASRFIAEKLGVKADEVLFIGDSHIDVRTAKNAGFHFAGAAWGYKPKQALIDEGAVYIAENREDIIKILDKIEENL